MSALSEAQAAQAALQQADQHLSNLIALLAATTPVYGAELPVGPFTDRTTAAWYRDFSSPVDVSGIHVSGAPDYGVAAMGYFSPAPPAPAANVVTVRDCIGENIGSNPPTMNGTAEAGLWFGTQVDVDRVRGDGSWMGAWVGAQTRDSTIRNLTCAKADGSKLPKAGLWIEHATRRLVIDGLTIRSSGPGILGEWWYSDGDYFPWLDKEYPGLIPAGKAGSLDVEIRNFDIEADNWGIFLDAGASGYYIHDGVISGPLGIAHPANLAVPSKPNRVDWSTIDYRGNGQRELIHTNPIG